MVKSLAPSHIIQTGLATWASGLHALYLPGHNWRSLNPVSTPKVFTLLRNDGIWCPSTKEYQMAGQIVESVVGYIPDSHQNKAEICHKLVT